MRFANHVSVIWDLSAMADWIPVIMACHDHLYVNPPPAPPTPVPFGLSSEIAVPIAWPPGALLGDHKLTSTVYHNHVWLALEGHDCGHGIMHLCIPPLMPGPCLEMQMDILMSSRKAKFSAGEVKANNAAVACCTMIDLAIVPTPMMVCGAMALPIAGTGTAVAFNSLLVGMHWIDLVAGWVDTVVSMVEGALLSAGGVSLGQIADGLGVNPIPDYGSNAGGLVRLLGQLTSDYHGDAQLGYNPISGPLASGGVTATRDGASGDITVERTEGLQAGGLAGIQRHDRLIYHAADGTIEEQHSITGSTIGGGGLERGTHRTDGGDWQEMTPTSNAPSLPWSEGTFTDVPFL